MSSVITRRIVQFVCVLVTALGVAACNVAQAQTIETHTQIKPIDQAAGHLQLQAVRSHGRRRSVYLVVVEDRAV